MIGGNVAESHFQRTLVIDILMEYRFIHTDVTLLHQSPIYHKTQFKMTSSLSNLFKCYLKLMKIIK